ncbi:MAG: hypothetical protein WB760_20460 [Xanthobacteraceae bacterium]
MLFAGRRPAKLDRELGFAAHALLPLCIHSHFLPAVMRGVRHVCYVLPFLGLAMLVVWMWHLLAPESYRWLSAGEIDHLQALLFSGAISALATAIATKKI